MRLFELLKYIGVSSENLKDFEVNALSTLEESGSNDIVYIHQDKYLEKLSECQAGAVLIQQKHLTQVPKHMQPIVVENPHLAFAYLSSFFAKEEFAEHCQDCKIAPSARIMNGAYIGKGVEIAEDCVIMPNVVIADRVKIGKGCRLYPNVVIYADSVLEERVMIHSGSVIGSDGFGYAHTKDGKHIKIYHNGRVVIESDVEIGANCTIDRAVFGETRIKSGSKIDNLVQIGHNCVLGENTILVSQVGLAGSTSTGRNVVMGGQAGTGGHIHIGDFTQIAGRGAVGKNLPPHTKWGGHPLMELDEWMKFYVNLRRMLKKNQKSPL